MRKSKKEFEQIEILKERMKLRILEQEISIKADIKELGANLTGAALTKQLKESLFKGPGLGLAMKLGFLAYSLVSDRMRRKRKK
jgi:hypothetical protein